MTFGELQAAVTADAFPASQDSDVRRWINVAYGAFWNYTPAWTFTLGEDTVTATGGDNEITDLPDDFQAAVGLYRHDGCKLSPVGYPTFVRCYLTDDPPSGDPVEYAVYNGAVKVGPRPAADGEYRLLYEKKLTPLLESQEVPAIPAEYHQALVDGARAEGLLLPDPDRAGVFQARFDRQMAAASVRYVRESADAPTHWPG